MGANYMSNTERDFLTHCVSKDIQSYPGPGSYKLKDSIKKSHEEPQLFDESQKAGNKNCFGNEARFDYQKPKINNDREQPTGDFGVHMSSIKDTEISNKRQAILDNLAG